MHLLRTACNRQVGNKHTKGYGHTMTKNNVLGKAITEYINRTGMKQVDLAEYLHVSERTVRRWKNGEDIVTDVRELRRLSTLLDVAPEILGIARETIIFTFEDIEPNIDAIWQLTRNARYHDAAIKLDKLLMDTSLLSIKDDTETLRTLAHLQHIAGYVKSQTHGKTKAYLAFKHYDEMANIARMILDNDLLIVGLSYAGDMLQRSGEVNKAIEYLEEACKIDTPDPSVKGNGVQLLGRAYFKAKQLGDFERAIKEAEELASMSSTMPVLAGIIKGQFNLGAVYEEYGRSLGLLRQLNQGMDYIDKADKDFKMNWKEQRRTLLINTARAMILVYGGEIREGVKVAIDVTEDCRKAGNIRQLDRIYGIYHHLDKLSREIGDVGKELRDVLDGPLEY